MLVNALYDFPTYMVFFTTPELLEIGGMPFVTPYDKPTRLEALRYYRRVADTYQLRVELGETVTSVHVPQPGGRWDLHDRDPIHAGDRNGASTAARWCWRSAVTAIRT